MSISEQLNKKHSKRKWILVLLLFIMSMLALSGYLGLMAWRMIYPEKQPVTPDREMLSLFETYLDIKIPDSTQQLSTWNVYDSGTQEWGTSLICKQEELWGVYEPNEWDLFAQDIKDGADFPLERSIRWVLIGGRIAWWNPDPQNISGVYIRNQTRRAHDNRTIKMLIENEKQGWVRLFILMRANDMYFPSTVAKLFELKGERDILIGEDYHTIHAIYNNNQIVYDVFQSCDAQMIMDCVGHTYFLSFPDRILASEAAATQDKYGKPSYILKVKIDSNDLDCFIKTIAETEDEWEENFMPYNRSLDTRNKVWRARTPEWYNEKITYGWICRKDFITQGNTGNLHNLYIDTSDSKVSIIYIDGRIREEVIKEYRADPNEYEESLSAK